MNDTKENLIGCAEFEDCISDYLDRNLDRTEHQRVAEHAMRCPLCHSLLNEVRDALAVCRELSPPQIQLAGLEARVLNVTAPQSVMDCERFEEHLSDYLDGFLSASIFHRWERHAVLCSYCTDLPGEVVRSIAACYTYKTMELEVPNGLHAKILESTIGSAKADQWTPSVGSRLSVWLRDLRFPSLFPQLAPVGMLLLIVALVFSQTSSSYGWFGGVYEKGFEMAGETYKQGSQIVLGTGDAIKESEVYQTPTNGTLIKNDK